MLISKSRLTSLLAGIVLSVAIPVLAQDAQSLLEQGNIQAEVDRITDRVDVVNEYRIGLDCAPTDAALKSHLHLGDDQGLTVNMVLPGSPAANAGMKRYDVVVKANGQPVAKVMDLVQQVNESRGGELTVTLMRGGEEHLVKMMPEKRDVEEMEQLRRRFHHRLGQGPLGGPQGLPDLAGMQELGDLFKQFPHLNQMGNGVFRSINPGIAIPSHPNVPKDFNLRIQRNNDQITVQRGEDTFEVTTDTLDQLPDDVRPMVENMLHGGGLDFGKLLAPNHAMPSRPGIPMRPQGVLPADPNPTQSKQLKDRFDGLELQLKELQDAIRSIENK